jgi:hypothetical protein
MLLLFACSKKEAVPEAQTTATQETPAPAPAAAPADSQYTKAVAAYQAFMQAYDNCPGNRDPQCVQDRIALSEKTRTGALMLLNEGKDLQAQQYLTKFTDLLLQYMDAARKVVPLADEIRKMSERLSEGKTNLQQMKDPAKRTATILELNALDKELTSLEKTQGENVGALDLLERDLRQLK